MNIFKGLEDYLYLEPLMLPLELVAELSFSYYFHTFLGNPYYNYFSL